MSNPQSGTIGCHCGICEITVADKRAVQYFRCGCEDCRQGIEWGSSRKTTKPNICTVKPDQLPHVYYIPADIISIKGKEFMSAYKLREDGRSIRLYCNQCWSLIAVEHPAYQSNVFYILPKHCVTSCDLSVPLTAILFMKDYPRTMKHPLKMMFLYFILLNINKSDNDFLPCRLLRIHLSDELIRLKA